MIRKTTADEVLKEYNQGQDRLFNPLSFHWYFEENRHDS